MAPGLAAAYATFYVSMTRAQNVCSVRRLSLHSGVRTRFAVLVSQTGGGDATAPCRQKSLSSTMHASEYCFGFSEHKEYAQGVVIPEWNF